MTSLTVLDAPIDCSGARRGEERAPAALRAAGLLDRLQAGDGGEAAARVSDPRRDPETGVIGAADIRRASSMIAAGVREILMGEGRPLVVGGDCTLLLGVFEGVPPGTGLWFVDGHADFLDGETSPTGEAADMDLAILTGHGPPGFLDGSGRLLDPASAVLLGHRPDELGLDVARENARLDPAIRAITAPQIRNQGATPVASYARDLLAGHPVWLHLDLDVLDAAALPAVSYPQPLGLDWDELTALGRALAEAPNLLGASVADFNPDHDPDGRHAERVVDALEQIFGLTKRP